jgi:hypothetical protein
MKKKMADKSETIIKKGKRYIARLQIVGHCLGCIFVLCKPHSCLGNRLIKKTRTTILKEFILKDNEK